MKHASAVGVVVLGTLLVFGACTPYMSGGRPVVWPKEATLGSTIGMALDSNYIPGIVSSSEKHTISRQNLTLQIRQGTTTLATVTPRAVFDGSAAPASIRNELQPGAWLTIVVFDLPASLSATLPASVTIRPMLGGTPLGHLGDLTITGSGGTPIQFVDSIGGDSLIDPADLETLATLRLQGLLDQGSGGFDPEWEIGGLQFELEYPVTQVENPRVSVLTEATGGSVFLGPETTPGHVTVFLTHPSGFYLPNLISSRVGEGPLLDIAFDKLEGEGFSDSDFTIRDLKVVSRDGELLTPAFSSGTDTTAWFTLISRRNLTE